MSRNALARAAGVDTAALARIEDEERPGMQFATVHKLASALGVSLDDLALGALSGAREHKRATQSAAALRRTLTARGLLIDALHELDAGIKDLK